MAMYNLYNFCNIIAELRRNRGWSQATLAEKLCISPQAISKWECGVGLPDVTLFPVIAETLGVPVGVLFGEKSEKEALSMQKSISKTEYKEEFPPCKFIDASAGNVCRIEFIDGERERAKVRAVGDPTFIRYFSAEREDGRLLIEVKNPSGSAEKWTPYDRDGYEGENLVQVFTGRELSNVEVLNYLDLRCDTGENNGNYEAVITPPDVGETVVVTRSLHKKMPRQ